VLSRGRANWTVTFVTGRETAFSIHTTPTFVKVLALKQDVETHFRRKKTGYDRKILHGEMRKVTKW
jgi:hypothetical protein